jgi:DNA-binding response OmpR family regulator
MPEMKGIELLEKVRNHAAMNLLPFVLVTTESELTNIVKIADLRVTDYITKPFDLNELKERIRNLINGLGLAQEAAGAKV